jgi:DNA-binding HxlR family transcriptional regulator
MEETFEETMRRITLECLEMTTDGSASSEEIRRAFNFEILWEDLNSTLEDLESRGFVKLHEQFQSGSKPKYDKVVLLEAGKDFLETLKNRI